MTNDAQRPLIPGSQNVDDVQRDGSVSPELSAKLSSAITDFLKKQWVAEDPGERCFDHDEARMALLSSFIVGQASTEGTEDARDHLLDCARCRYLYARVCESTATLSSARADNLTRSEEPIPDTISSALHTTGLVAFPDGNVGQGAWEFGRLETLSCDDFDAISGTIAGRAWEVLKSWVPRKEVVLVCFSRPIHCCGKRLATKMIDSGVKDVHVVMADDFFSPRLWCGPKELDKQDVVVFVDVVHTGGLLNRLFAVCREAKPREIVGLAIIDQSIQGEFTEPFRQLWREPPDTRTRFDSDIHDQARFFDPTAALSRPRQDLPREIADPSAARVTVERDLSAIEPLTRFIEATSALRRDAKINGVNYPWAVDLLRLLRHDEARAELAERAVANLEELAKRGPWCLMYPAERSRRAGAWAELIATALQWPMIAIGRKARIHYRQLTGGQRRSLAKYPRALVVDAAIRTGKTLQSIVELLRSGDNPPPCEIAAFYAFDGLFHEARDDLEKKAKVEIRSLFRLPLGVPTEPVGNSCRWQMTSTLQELTGLEALPESAWRRIVRDYCKKKVRECSSRIRQESLHDIRAGLRHALEAGSRGAEVQLVQSCHPPRASLVKHLDVAYALSEPRTRNVIHGFLNNSMPPDFIEWCALALATQKDYEWLDRDWLILHRRLFTNAASHRWQFLACVSYWIRQHGDEAQVRRARQAIDDFRSSQLSRLSAPTHALTTQPDAPESLDARCRMLISILSCS
jgi:hypothetical protein